MSISRDILNKLYNNDSSLKDLDLTGMIKNSNDIELLVEALEDNTNLNTLTIQGGSGTNYAINDDDVVLLSRCKSITKLNLHGNNITDKGAFTLAQNGLIRDLDVSSCSISILGLYHFLKNQALLKLNVESNIFYFDRKEENIIRILNISYKYLMSIIAESGIQIPQEIMEKALNDDRDAVNNILDYFVTNHNYVYEGIHSFVNDVNMVKSNINKMNLVEIKWELFKTSLSMNNLKLLDLYRLKNTNDFEYLANGVSGETIKYYTGIEIPAELLEKTFNGDVKATNDVFEYLIKIYYNIDIKCKILSLAYEIWEKGMVTCLEDNKARINPKFSHELQMQRKLLALEDRVMKAIDHDDVEQLAYLIPELPDGIDSILSEGDSLIEYALSENKIKSGLFLIRHSVKVESHFRRKTLLFTAAEKGKLEFVQMLLLHGANITGEFNFNPETALSIAAFKMNDSVNKLIFKYPEIVKKFPELLIGKCDRIKKVYSGCFGGKAEAWEKFSNPDLLFIHSYLALDVIPLFRKCSSNNEKLKNDPTFSDADHYSRIYTLIHDKYAILKKTKIKDCRHFDKLQGERIYRLLPLVKKDQATKHYDHNSLNIKLEELNEELKAKEESEIDWTIYPFLFIAQYRGIHYYTHYFDINQRQDHIQTSHLGRMAAAPAIYCMSSLTPLDHQIARESDLKKNAGLLGNVFDGFFENTEFKSESKTYKSTGYYLQERMTNDYDGYKQDIKSRKNTAYELLDDMKAHGYPSYASSDFVTHPLRYSAGQKQIKGFAQHILRPCYNVYGKPQNPVLGKIFIGLYTPLEMANLRTRHAAGMHNRFLIDGKDTITPERESGVIGGVNSGYIFYEESIEVPDFSCEWKEDFVIIFGINKLEFEKYKNIILKCAGRVPATFEKEIIDKIISHKEIQLLREAQEEAKRRGGYLIYRNYDKCYSIMLEPMRGFSAPFKRETELINSLASEKFSPLLSRKRVRDEDSNTISEKSMKYGSKSESLCENKIKKFPLSDFMNMENLNTTNKNYGRDSTANYAGNQALFKPVSSAQDNRVTSLLAYFGSSDGDSIALTDEIQISRGEVHDAVRDADQCYSADYMNLLLHGSGVGLSARIYPALPVNLLSQCALGIVAQQEDFAIVPLNVAYDEKSPAQKNHWAALMIDKQNECIFYLDPARKKWSFEVEKLKTFLGYDKSVIGNPVDLQQNEKNEGWIRHCGVYTIEIFKALINSIRNGQIVSGCQIQNPELPTSVTVETILSVIPSGAADDIGRIRMQHIKEAGNILREHVESMIEESNTNMNGTAFM